MARRPHMTTEARRRRVIQRHALDRSAEGPLEATRTMFALHSSDPTTPFVSVWARTGAGLGVEGLERELYEARTLWRLHGMRRTLFVVDREEAPWVLSGAAEALAVRERKRVCKRFASVASGSVERWLARLEDEVLALLSDGVPRATQEIGEVISGLEASVEIGFGTWRQSATVASKLLLMMAMEGRLVRTQTAGTWRASQYRWSVPSVWFGVEDAPRVSVAEAQAWIVRRYLDVFGPATLDDVRWWTGWGVRAVRSALEAVDPITVGLDGGREGFALEGALEEVALPDDAASRVAFLPSLDATPMGWHEREWFLGAHRDALFDRNGNIGPTVWWEGRIVGGWGQRAGGDVCVKLLEDVGAEADAAVKARAAELEVWLGGVVVKPRFPTPLERAMR